MKADFLISAEDRSVGSELLTHVKKDYIYILCMTALVLFTWFVL